MLESPVQRGEFITREGELVLEQAQAPGLTGLTGRSLGEPDAGLICFGTRFVERAAQLLEPALEQEGPVRAYATTRSRYAFCKAKGPCVTIAKRVSSRNPAPARRPLRRPYLDVESRAFCARCSVTNSFNNRKASRPLRS